MKTVQVRKNAFLVLGALSFLTVLLSGCLKEAQNSTVTPKTYISLLHLAPVAPSVEVYFDNTKASSAISYGMVSPSYSALEPGAFGISFKKASSDSVVASLPSAFYDSLSYYTLVLYNTDPTHVGALRIKDDYSGLTSDKSFYRFFHLSPDVGAVDLYFDNNLIDPSRQYADNAAGSFYNDFNSITPNTHSVVVKKANSDSVIASLSSVTLSAGDAFTLYLKGVSGGTGSNAVLLDYLQAAD